jgi:Xaa-Pro dipeptidase
MSHPRSRTTRRELLACGGLATGAAFAACQSPPRRAERPAAQFPELSDQRATVAPISADERAARRARLAALLAGAGVDAYFCEGGATLAYLAGVSWGLSERTFGLVLRADGSHAWITPRFEAEKATLAIAPEAGGPGGELLTWEEDQYARHAFAELARRGVRRLALDPSTRLLVRDEARAAGFTDEALVGARGLLVALRARKDAHELALLRRAAELTQRALVAAAPRIELGMRAGEVADLVAGAQSALGLERPWVLALIGPAAAYPHGDDRGRELASGDFLLVDTGGSFHGYQSDITRTWVPVGRPGERALSIWHTVRAAQQGAFEAIRPGVTCAEVDRAARGVIDRAGLGPDYRAFTHRLGHGIGMEGHEDPYFDRGSQVRLEPGMTLSNEPGVYLYGELGVRLEDIVAVTEDGAESFGSWQAGPLSPAGEARA